MLRGFVAASASDDESGGERSAADRVAVKEWMLLMGRGGIPLKDASVFYGADPLDMIAADPPLEVTWPQRATVTEVGASGL